MTGVVAAAAYASAMALRVVRIVLETIARKQSSQRLEELMQMASQEGERLAQLAAEDGAAYAAYMQARRHGGEEAEAALRRAIEIPIAAARAAAAGIDLCAEALPFARGAIGADVAGASALLAGAIRAILCSVDANLREVKDEVFARETTAERARLEERARAALR